jgi:hypothetical protein
VKRIFRVILLRSRKFYNLSDNGLEDVNGDTCLISSSGFCLGRGFSIGFSENKGMMAEEASLSFSSRLPRDSLRIFSVGELSYGPPWAHYLGGYQDRLLGGPLGLPGLRYTAPEGVQHKDYGGEVLG